MSQGKYISGPLSGTSIVVTRAEEDQCHLVAQLEKLGAKVIGIPSIVKKALLPFQERLTLLKQIKGYDWILFTSPFAVQVLHTEVISLASACRHTKVAAVGPTTSKALEKLGVQVDTMPNPHTWKHFSECLGNIESQSICLPRSRRGAIEFPEMLRMKGARVVEIWTYDTVTHVPKREVWQPLEEKTDFILFTSGTTVKGFHQGLLDHGLTSTIAHSKLVCIGPSTASVCKDAFGRADIIAQPHTEGGLIASLINQINLENQHD